MPSVSYDNNAFYFFAATMLFLFAVPSSIYIFRTIRSFKPGVKLPEDLAYAVSIPTHTPVQWAVCLVIPRHSFPPHPCTLVNPSLPLSPTFPPPHPPAQPHTLHPPQPRSEEEKKKLVFLKRRIHAPELWTFSFRVCTYATIIAAILFVVCLVVAARTPSLAVYDPYLVSFSSLVYTSIQLPAGKVACCFTLLFPLKTLTFLPSFFTSPPILLFTFFSPCVLVLF